MAIAVFRDDDAGFVGWLRANPGGLVVHADTLKLHRSDCDHIHPSGYEEESLTRRPKVCGTDRTELELWALREKRKQLRPCESCEP
jgi:hypothetical protein